MPDHPLLYYITDRNAFPGDESTGRRRLLHKIAEAARAGVDYIQLREKDLSTCELESLAREAVSVIREARQPASGPWPQAPALLINSRTDVALAVGADGVLLRSDDISPQEVRVIWGKSHVGTAALDCSAARSAATACATPIIGVSCHSPEEVDRAAENGGTFAVFAPVFEKKDAPDTRPAGLAMLRQACAVKIPVLALGGITLANAQTCLEAGAAGIAAIRLFQENDVAEIVRLLHAW